ncbi:MAG: ribulose-phosphate 3-epimerase [Actinobacteria bacterium]|nr:ribulose-phosphate 3-epimerase [Actinomycetota bacterium]
MGHELFIAPSILSADFTRLAEAVALVEDAGADLIHVDVMDGHFVPNLTIGPPVVRALKRVARRPLDVHLMVSDPDSTAQWYVDAGADIVTVHVEASADLRHTLQAIGAAGVTPGVTLNPDTPVSTIREVLPIVGLVLVMSVNPGFGGQSFIESSVAKVAEIASMCEEAGASPRIEVDGGIDALTAPRVVSAGADTLVAGNAIFGAADPAAALREIRARAEAHLV